MELKIVISADSTALEFARNFGKILGAYISQADIEAGLSGKAIKATIEPDTLPWEDEVEKGRQYAEQAQKAGEETAKAAIEKYERSVQESKAVKEQPADAITAEELQTLCADLGEKFGKAAFKELKAKAGFSSMKALDAKGRSEFANMINAYMKEHADA